MSWKQFLKPDWRKVVITAIGIFVLVVYLMNPKSAMKADVFGITIIFVWPLLLFGILLGYLNIGNEGFLQFYLIFGSIVCLTYFYSISCIIIWFDNRRKKK